MAGQKYLTSPLPSTRIPAGIPYIISNEAAERFSFYGMQTILVVFMTQHLMGPDGRLAVMPDREATALYHTFVSAVYFTPFLGALLSDVFLGKYRTIISLSIVYCLGHLALALNDTRLGLFIGLALISLGSGGIKPCVSAHVGDQFGTMNKHLLEKVFGWFYFAINLGAFASTLLTPWLLDRKEFGPRWAFGVPGVLMLIATLVFWIGRRRFVHVPPGGKAFLRETLGREGLTAVFKLVVIYVFVVMFWALYYQTGSAWVLQAEHMDRHWLGYEWLPSQIQAANPLLIMLLIPAFSYGVYPAIGRLIRLTPLRKISIGFFVMVVAFAFPILIEGRIAAGLRPSIAWQLLAYVILTASEVMVSITCLEFSYTQAPRKMKSFVMALFLMSISLGNAFTAAVNYLIQNKDGTSKLSGVDYYLFFTLAMLVTALCFTAVAARYRERTYIQGET